MLPAPLPAQQSTCLSKYRAGAGSIALAWLALASAPALAEDSGKAQASALFQQQDESAGDPERGTIGEDLSVPDEIEFEADGVAYDSDADILTATGNVVLRGDDQSVRADTVQWDRRAGVIRANGNVRFVDADGNQIYASELELTDKFEAGAMNDLLLALREGGRLAAESGERSEDGTVVLNRAAYSGCAVTTPEGCDKKPSWRITADRVIYDPVKRQVRFRDAYLELFGARLLPLPGLSIRTDGGAISGFLIPDIRISESNGLELSGEYYYRVADNKDLTLGAHVYTDAPPMASAKWRHLTEQGAYQVTAYGTHSRRISDFTGIATSEQDFRGYLFANGRFQFDEHWSLDTSIRIASDRTFLRRYDISRDDRLRSIAQLERVDTDSYLQIAGYATQTLRLNQEQGQVPMALPVIDYRRRIDDPWLGGMFQFQANTMAITRDVGQDTQRAFASARWDLRKITPMGQVLQLTALSRADVYHSDENLLTDTAIYRGNPGWETRGVVLAAADLQWPLAGPALGGLQVFTPRVQVVASPETKNLAIPNEDARAIDLEDSNLFALNRFPGYDRIEDGLRVTYGFDWELSRPGWRVKTTLGQSYRLDKDPDVLIDGTGLSERLSDFVGRTEVRFKDFVSVTHRYRLDKDNLAVRRNEFDATVGSRRTYIEVGYLRLDRDIAQGIEDLQDREEVRLATRVAFADYWSLFGAGVFNLTDRNEDPTLSSDGFQPLRTRLGVAYQDDCLEFGFTWRRDYVDQGDAQRGDTFQVYFSLRNLGFR
ncbi:MAG: LPS-assembly protein LptD [Erythrobacter sp.]|jgi:LPS-assembly protein|nr:LPS-assembly protein LptD [Erythrobacter sp.]RZV35258.1 MAG: LPS-assembly protein LptD [Sphingomonadaceae bacterium]